MFNKTSKLPATMPEFDKWSDKIIKAADLTATVESQKWTLASMIMHLGPTEAYKSNKFFVKALRKTACNEIAWGYMESAKKAQKERQEAIERKEKAAAFIEQAREDAVLQESQQSPLVADTNDSPSKG